MNLQLRLITEDNIEQLENLAFSHNIDKLLFQPNITPQEVVQNLQNEVRVKRNGPANVDIPSENPEIEPLAYPVAVGSESPQYADESPAYVPPPNSQSTESNSFGFNPFTPPGSPKYQPTSPDFPPPPLEGFQPKSPDFPPSPVAGFEPTSPDFPPPSSEDVEYRGGTWEPEMNDMVHLRGGAAGQQNKRWRVKHKTPNFVTLEDMAGEIHVASYPEVYPIGDYSVENTPTPISNPFNAAITPSLPLTQMMPAFQFSPSIKITTGNDYSNTPLAGTPEITTTNIGERIPPSISSGQPIMLGAEKGGNASPDDGVLDFNNLVIVKK